MKCDVEGCKKEAKFEVESEVYPGGTSIIRYCEEDYKFKKKQFGGWWINVKDLSTGKMILEG